MNIRRIPLRRLLDMVRETEHVGGQGSTAARILRRELDRRQRQAKGRKGVNNGR